MPADPFLVDSSLSEIPDPRLLHSAFWKIPRHRKIEFYSHFVGNPALCGSSNREQIHHYWSFLHIKHQGRSEGIISRGVPAHYFTEYQ